MSDSVPQEKGSRVDENSLLSGPLNSHSKFMLRLRNRLFHWWFLLRRPMTLGVRAIVHDAGAGTVLLVRHTYVPGWNLPGGGVDTGETLLTALERELAEEANIVALEAPRLVSVHLNLTASRRDHVAVFAISEFRQTDLKIPDREIAEAGFFHHDDLPADISPGARNRIREFVGGLPPDSYW